MYHLHWQMLCDNACDNAATAMQIVLALATLGVATKIETILSVLLRPRWPRQVTRNCRCRQRHRANFRQWKHGVKVFIELTTEIGLQLMTGSQKSSSA
jgi:hypothetical protein